MRVWGIGANWGDEPLKDSFVLNDCLTVGWSKEVAPDLYAMLEEIQVNDIVYIKSFVPKNRIVNVYAVGVVSKPLDINNQKNSDVIVEWFADLTKQPIQISLNDVGGKNNVYSNTLYKEYNENIQNKIFEKIRERLL